MPPLVGLFPLFLREDGQKRRMVPGEIKSYATGPEVFAQLEATGVEFEEQSGVDKQRVKRGFFS